MMKIPELDEATIREHTQSGSFERGERYFREGAVVQLEQKERAVKAHVKGGRPAPYSVQVRYDDEEITDVACTCPYHQGSWCKHIVAVLLAVLERSSDEDEPAVTALLQELERDALVTLVERLIADHPELADRVRREGELLR